MGKSFGAFLAPYGCRRGKVSDSAARKLVCKLAEPFLRLPVCRIDLQHLFPGLEFEFVVSRSRHDGGHARDCAEMARFERQDTADVGHRLVVIAHRIIQRRPPVPAFRVVGHQHDDLVEQVQRKAVLLVRHRLVGPLHQQVCRRAAGIAPFSPDTLADPLGLPLVSFPLEFGKQRVEAVCWLNRRRVGFGPVLGESGYVSGTANQEHGEENGDKSGKRKMAHDGKLVRLRQISNAKLCEGREAFGFSPDEP
ncbi:conserved hypothetical protein [Hoeflea sp. EC-HK425]|nr:conserved hypothetical protein [Hoeflea sp. EC-HK425]